MNNFVDYKGKQIFYGDEYFIDEMEHGFVAINAEDIQNYMIERYEDQRLMTDDFDQLREVLRIYYDMYSEILGG